MHFDTHFLQAAYVLNVPIESDLAVHWACELLAEGFDSHHLAILAGMQPDTMGRHETWEIIGRILDELHLPPLSREGAVRIYLTTLLKGYLANQVTTNRILGEFCFLHTHSPINLFYPFYLLNHELGNIDYADPGLYYHKLADLGEVNNEIILAEIAKWTCYETEKLLVFLESEDETLISEQLEGLQFAWSTL